MMPFAPKECILKPTELCFSDVAMPPYLICHQYKVQNPPPPQFPFDRAEDYNIFYGDPEGKRPFWRPRLRCDYNIRMDLREVGWEGVDWIHLSEDRDRRSQ
jgi:hypothetical protein